MKIMKMVMHLSYSLAPIDFMLNASITGLEIAYCARHAANKLLTYKSHTDKSPTTIVS